MWFLHFAFAFNTNLFSCLKSVETGVLGHRSSFAFARDPLSFVGAGAFG